MASQSCLVALLSIALPIAAVETPPPADPNRPVTVQTTTTQTWVPGRWVRVENQDVWQPGHWEMVQTTTTLPTATATPAPSSPPVVAQQSASPMWVSERWEQTPDGWLRYAGRWSNQPDVIVERRANEVPTRTVVVERPVETVVVERPVYTSPVYTSPVYTTSTVGLGVGWGGHSSPSWSIGIGYGFPGFCSSVVKPYRSSWHHPHSYITPICHPRGIVARPTVSVGGGGTFIRHR